MGCNMNDGMNRNTGRDTNGCMNRNMGRNMNCDINRNMGRDVNCNMNRNMAKNGNCNMNRNMSGNGNCNMNRNMTGNTNNNMNRNANERNINERQMRSNMAQNRQGCGCTGDNMGKGDCKKMHGCNIETEPVDRMAPGMAFVPWQKWEDVYCMEKGLERGTIFEQLDKPFLGGRVK